ncbi:MAG: YdeI/OmpD-associated family protein [Phaeodactylibacter sp.]|nr:YdeI/OmpD-associated family protein [Phaeodactylibacter sp.]
MEITEVFYPRRRSEWRAWLETHHQSKSEVWLRRFRKAAGKPSISYDSLVEECLCFGWIDGVVKKYCEESNVQRITPRRKKNSFLSELNRQRVWKLQRLGLMTPAGLAPIRDQVGSPDEPWEIPEWIEAQLREDPEAWNNFQQFSHFYKRLKTGWIMECMPRRREEAQKRLDYLIKMTRQGKMYGTVPEVE